jgi:hypothetical protein
MKKRIGFLALGIAALSLVTVPGKAETERGTAEFGLVGLTLFDTARLNAFCPSDPSMPNGSCIVTFEFRDIQGRLLKQSSLTLSPNTGNYIDLRTAEAGSALGRLMILPRITVKRGGVIATLEIFDDGTGRTSVFAQPVTSVLPAVQ